jgi:hypothetical protein
MGPGRYMIGDLIGDSGAVSKVAGSSNLTVKRVITLFLLYGHLLTRYFTFDEDFSDQGLEINYHNQYIMEKARLTPVPAIHNFFSDEIEYYASCGKYQWLALGSSQSTKFENIQYAVHKIKKINPGIKIHWFGGSRFDWLIKLPIASCDTSSWTKVGMQGHINFWNLEKNKSHKIYIAGRIKSKEADEYHFVTYPWRPELERYLKENFDLTYKNLCGYDAFTNMGVINTRFYVELQNRINEERVKRGVPLE